MKPTSNAALWMMIRRPADNQGTHPPHPANWVCPSELVLMPCTLSASSWLSQPGWKYRCRLLPVGLAADAAPRSQFTMRSPPRPKGRWFRVQNNLPGHQWFSNGVHGSCTSGFLHHQIFLRRDGLTRQARLGFQPLAARSSKSSLPPAALEFEPLAHDDVAGGAMHASCRRHARC